MPACRRRNTGCHACRCLPVRCHFASGRDNDGVTILSGWRSVQVARSLQRCRASRLTVLCALTKIVMRAQSTVSRAARRWHTLVGVRWLRWQSFVAALYFRRVTYPVRCWVALGSPAQFRPSLPWWQSIAWHYLHITGWLSAPRRNRPLTCSGGKKPRDPIDCPSPHLDAGL